MPTKAELEAELDSLRSEMAELQAARAERSQAQARGEDDLAVSVEEGAAMVDEARDALEQTVREVATELEAAAERNPAIALVGVFVAGFIVGRMLAR